MKHSRKSARIALVLIAFFFITVPAIGWIASSISPNSSLPAEIENYTVSASAQEEPSIPDTFTTTATEEISVTSEISSDADTEELVSTEEVKPTPEPEPATATTVELEVKKEVTPAVKTAPAQIAPKQAPVAPKKTTLAVVANPATPVRVSIPSISLNSPVVGVGQNEKGEMDVPGGKTNNVGWYKYGTVPGNPGSAVLDAHVFAAFSELKYVKKGSDIYVTTADGMKLHFVVSHVQTYALSDLSPETLFAPSGERLLNLITCAGSPTADGSTYTHRLVVYTKFVGAEVA